MNGRRLLLALASLAGILAIGGCNNGQPRMKGLDAFDSAVLPNRYGPLPGIDPYSFGGAAYATGGLEPASSYGTGASGNSDGDPLHYRAIDAVNGALWPIDWGTGASDSSGIVVPQPPKPIGD